MVHYVIISQFVEDKGGQVLLMKSNRELRGRVTVKLHYGRWVENLNDLLEFYAKIVNDILTSFSFYQFIACICLDIII